MRNLLFISLLFTCLAILTSCEKEDAYAIKCFGENCRQETNYPICQDDHILIVSEDLNTVFCPNGCLVDHCIQECTDGMTSCLSDSLLQICQNGEWTTITCEYLCVAGTCIENQVLCQDDERRCVDSDVQVCHQGVWKLFETCPNGCSNGQCESCNDGEQRCSDANVEMCIGGEWITKENCPDKCNNGKCVEGCNGPNVCLDSMTLQQCIDNAWQTTTCRNGCENGRCRPDVEGSVDPRLVGRLCTIDDMKYESSLYIEYDDTEHACHGNLENFLGSVCIAGSIDMTYCLDRCDPNNPSNYYCYSSTNSVYAYTADCVQISDGSYALINTSAYACESSCSPQNGCDKIIKSYGPYGGIPCNSKQFYCDGTIAHTCEGTMECSQYGNKTCVQFGIPTYCATPCENEGDVISECVYYFSNSATCMRDDHGTLTWQYTPPSKCENGCNTKTGLCN